VRRRRRRRRLCRRRRRRPKLVPYEWAPARRRRREDTKFSVSPGTACRLLP